MNEHAVGVVPRQRSGASWRGRFPHVPLIGKLLRCAAVSAQTTALSLTILLILVRFVGIGAVAANIIASSVGIGPSYALNRRWVWKRRGRSRVVREVLPFWIFSLAGLAASSAAVGAAARTAAAWTPTTRSLFVGAANLAAFGGLWVLQFVLLDRVIFRGPTNLSDDSQPTLTTLACAEPILTSSAFASQETP